MAISSQGTTFSFPGVGGLLTSVSVEEPEMEIVDMTPWDDEFVNGFGRKRLVATGDMKSPGKVTVEYLRGPGTASPLSMRGTYGQLVLATPSGRPGRGLGGGATIVKQAYLESATTEIAVGDLIRGRITFLIDHTYD